jgi:hypothetical protein
MAPGRLRLRQRIAAPPSGVFSTERLLRNSGYVAQKLCRRLTPFPARGDCGCPAHAAGAEHRTGRGEPGAMLAAAVVRSATTAKQIERCPFCRFALECNQKTSRLARGGWLFGPGCPQALVDALILDWNFLANWDFLWSLVLGCTIPVAAALSTRRVALLKAASRVAWSPFSASSNFLMAVFMADRCAELRTARSWDRSARLIAERFFAILSSLFLRL